MVLCLAKGNDRAGAYGRRTALAHGRRHPPRPIRQLRPDVRRVMQAVCRPVRSSDDLARERGANLGRVTDLKCYSRAQADSVDSTPLHFKLPPRGAHRGRRGSGLFLCRSELLERSSLSLSHSCSHAVCVSLRGRRGVAPVYHGLSILARRPSARSGYRRLRTPHSPFSTKPR